MGLLNFLNQAGDKLISGDLDLAMGLLAASGPSTQPRGFGNVLAEATQFASDRDKARMRNEFIRSQMEAQKRRQSAMKALPQVMSGPTAETSGAPFMTSAQQQQKMMGLLGEIAPEQLATGLLGQMFPKERSEPADLRMMRELGFPVTQEGYRAYKQYNTEVDPNSALETTLLQAEIAIAQANLQKANRENMAAVTEKKVEQVQRLESVQETAEVGDSLLNALDGLEGTFLETGTSWQPFKKSLLSTGAEIVDSFGGDSSKARETLSHYNTFKKDTNIFAINLVKDLEDATNKKFDTLIQSIPNLDADPNTNRKVLRTFLTKSLSELDKVGPNAAPEQRQVIQSMIERINKSEELFKETGFGIDRPSNTFQLPDFPKVQIEWIN